jgi:hypothetical protein
MPNIKQALDRLQAHFLNSIKNGLEYCNINASGGISNLSAICLFNETLYLRSKEARATFDWAMAKRLPTQILGPAPNGKNTPMEKMVI